MMIMQFFHENELLIVDGVEYRATCKVRNELNRWRKPNQIVKTYPINGPRSPYYPRPFPTGVWEVKEPVWTTDPEYAPVKIPTDAFRRVLTMTTLAGNYDELSGKTQSDAFYHLHFCKGSSTTLGCIRLDSEEDAEEIALAVKNARKAGKEVWLEVCVKKG